MSRRPVRLLVAAPLLAVPLSACSFGGTDSLPADEVADGAEDALEDQVGVRPEVSCPEDLVAEVGAETRCTLTVDGDPEQYGVTVTVTSVEDDTANFDVQVDDEPLG
ncbi:DUF4333 domain-containing protein [Blastococcus brunescens]|uniref:DUF4333 domain-containing protein n=1 Tax=Blastococcus brunescens TaxID=1564165 RepID=A0ABZ1B0X0_9ACTN|nr:DUF4333 domain-containing protein [Blastococcus sp. BMG 8361]WRL64007.1 DUF4333 domain-containing protein [Blastococcus sp. BMG 8361]